MLVLTQRDSSLVPREVSQSVRCATCAGVSGIPSRGSSRGHQGSEECGPQSVAAEQHCEGDSRAACLPPPPRGSGAALVEGGRELARVSLALDSWCAASPGGCARWLGVDVQCLFLGWGPWLDRVLMLSLLRCARVVCIEVGALT